MKTINQEGIAHTGLVLIVVLVAAIGFAGWKVYDASRVTQGSDEINAQRQTVTETEDKKPTVIEGTQGWLEYKSSKFSIRLADGWKLYRHPQVDGVLYGDQIDYKEGTKAEIESKLGGRSGTSRFSVTYDDIAEDNEYSHFQKDATEVTQLKTENGSAITRYKKTITEELSPTEGPPKGTIAYDYSIKGMKGDMLLINYEIRQGDTNHLEIVEKVVKTVKFL
jgi:hypothetical protein